MSQAIALLLISLGCAPASFQGLSGPFVIWVCPPVVAAPPAADEREG